MKFVEVYIISVLVWSVLLNFYLYQKNKRLEKLLVISNLKEAFLFHPKIKIQHELQILIISLFIAPLLLGASLVFGLYKTVESLYKK